MNKKEYHYLTFYSKDGHSIKILNLSDLIHSDYKIPEGTVFIELLSQKNNSSSLLFTILSKENSEVVTKENDSYFIINENDQVFNLSCSYSYSDNLKEMQKIVKRIIKYFNKFNMNYSRSINKDMDFQLVRLFCN